jgi:hypothetical protein
LHQNIFERLAYFSLNFLLLFLNGLAFGNFGCHYCHKSLIFDKQLRGLPNLQWYKSMDTTFERLRDISLNFSAFMLMWTNCFGNKIPLQRALKVVEVHQLLSIFCFGCLVFYLPPWAPPPPHSVLPERLTQAKPDCCNWLKTGFKLVSKNIMNCLYWNRFLTIKKLILHFLKWFKQIFSHFSKVAITVAQLKSRSPTR